MTRTSLLLLCLGCAPLAPTAAAPVRPAAAPPAPTRFVALGSNNGTFCARSEAGALYCWGLVTRPGAPPYAETPRPLPIPGLLPLAASSVLGFPDILGIDRGGGLHTVSRSEAGLRVPPRLRPSVRLRPTPSPSMNIPQRSGLLALEPDWPFFSGPVLTVREACLLGADRRPLCESHHRCNESGPAFVGIPVTLSALGGSRYAGIGPAGEPLGWNLDSSPQTLLGRRVGPYEAFRLPLPAPATDVVFTWGSEPDVACALSPGGAVTCTDAQLTARLRELAEGHAVRALDERDWYLLCLLRDDGERRCQPVWHWPHPGSDPRLERRLAGLKGLDASLGLAVGSEAICALGKERVPRCFGEEGSLLLGDGSTPRLPEPVRLPEYEGVVELTSDEGITCARFGPTRIRCFGSGSYEQGRERDLRLPEPVSEMRGASTLCVHGASSGRWYCRDPEGSWFHRSLPDGFEPLRDEAGRPLGGDLTSLFIESSGRIEVTRPDGMVGRFFFEARSQPLRFKFVAPGTPPLRGRVWTPDPAPTGTPKLAQIAGSCGRTATGELWCWGLRRHLPGPLDRLEARPVVLP